MALSDNVAALATRIAQEIKALRTEKGAASGIATLDSGSRLTSSQIPRVVAVNTTASITSGAPTLTLNAAIAGSAITVDITVTANGTIAVPTNGVNKQVIRGACYAAAAQTVSFATGIRTSTGLTRGPYSIPAGQVLFFALEYSTLISAWVLTAATVSAT